MGRFRGRRDGLDRGFGAQLAGLQTLLHKVGGFDALGYGGKWKFRPAQVAVPAGVPTS